MDRRLIILIIALIGSCFTLKAQSKNEHLQIDTIKINNRVYKPNEHLIGIRYGIAFTNIISSPNLKPKSVFSPVNVAITYTYYQAMWGYLDYFGLQTGLKYGSHGYTTLANIGGIDQTITSLELPILTAFSFDVAKDRLRILASLGMFLGYHLTTTREKGWDCYDNRFDFGVLGSVGLGVKIHPFEIHLEFGYQYSMIPLFDQQRQSSIYWLDIHTSQFFLNLGLHYHF